MKLDDEKLYEYLQIANEAITFLLQENQKHTKVLRALCDAVMYQAKFNMKGGEL